MKEDVQQQQYVFEILWNKAIPAEQKIREIEEGVIPVRTRLLENRDEIINEIRCLNNSASKLSICSAFGGMQMSLQLSLRFIEESGREASNMKR